MKKIKLKNKPKGLTRREINRAIKILEEDLKSRKKTNGKQQSIYSKNL